jgi:ATP-dependent DNA ligase
MIKRTNSELIKACEERGIQVSPSNTKRELLSILIHNSLRSIKNPSWGLIRRITINSPMLCSSYNELSREQKSDILESDRWIAEPKYYGCRAIICYHPSEGFTFWSRVHDSNTFLPTELTDKIVISVGDEKTSPKDWIGRFEDEFVLDAMIHSETTSKRKQDAKYLGLEQNLVSLTLDSSPEEAIEMQMSQFPLKITVFDLLYLGNRAIWGKDLCKRKEELENLYDRYQLPFSKAPYVNSDKIEFYNECVEDGMEGVVFKNLDCPYEPTTYRRKDGMVRLKQRMFQGFTEDLDAYIIGSRAPEQGAPGCAYVDTLILGVYLVDQFGNEVEHVLAEVDQIPLDIRVLVSEQTPFSDGFNPRLKRQYFGKVVTFRGRKFDPEKIVFKEASIDWFKGFRPDKDRFDCVVEPRELALSVV